MLRYAALLLVLLISQVSSAQSPSVFQIQREAAIQVKGLEPDLHVRIQHLEAPSPDGTSYRSFLMQQKREAAKRFQSKYKSSLGTAATLPEPATGTSFATTRTLLNGNRVNLAGGIPNDNTLAVSKDGMVLIGVNTYLYGYDSKRDTTVFPNATLNLSNLGGGGLANFYYDPKLIYDEVEDRFILVFLKNSDPATSAIIVCFSASNDPAGTWYRYTLPGNPLNNNRWTDYPAISITRDHVFITANLIVPNEPWQTGFDGSVIWQLEKHLGFDGATSIASVLYPPPRFNGRFIRNLCPVNGALQYADKGIFLSNRNFALVNDSIFMVELVPGGPGVPGPLTVSMVKSNQYYGVPPNGKQTDTDLQDPTQGLQTNDARVLGAIQFGDVIQFVGNSHDTASGKACVYHGRLTRTNNQWECTGTLFKDAVLDIAYPNIAAAGNESCEEMMMVVCDFTSKTDFPGTGAYYTDGKGNFSPLMRLKNGENYVDRLQGGYERWGDYSGAYRQGKEPKIWVSGFYGTIANLNSTFTTEIFLPDTSRMRINASLSGNPVFCDAKIIAQASGATDPIAWFWDAVEGSDTLSNVCNLSTHKLLVQDQRGCRDSLTFSVDTIFPLPDVAVYPNPTYGDMAIQFTSDADQRIRISLYDEAGRLVMLLAERDILKGLNQIVVDLLPLRAGNYELVVVNERNTLVRKRIMRM